MSTHSLRIRLLLASGLSIIVALAVAGIVLSALFSDHVLRGITTNLEAEMNRLTALVDVDAERLGLTQPMSDPRFATPYGGIYWQITDPKTGETARSPSIWDKVLGFPLPLPANGTIAQATIQDPEGASAVALSRRLGFETASGGERVLDLIVAEDDGALNAANLTFRFDLIRALVVLAIILMIAAWVQVTLGLSPLSVIRRGIMAIRTGKAATLEGDYPSEVMPLVNEVNELTRAHEVSIAFARARAADLAHGLKTSLTVLNAEAQAIRAAGNATAADAIEGLAHNMTETIDHQLSLARLRHRTPSGFQATAAAAATARVVAALKKTPKGAALDWTASISDNLVVNIDQPDLTELLGVVLENATQWATHRVVIEGRSEGGAVTLDVADDGPGLDEDKLQSIGERGRRLDEARSGSGLGLSIAREIVALNQGTLSFARATLGGLRVTITLPTAATVDPG